MSRKKLLHFKEAETFPNVYHFAEENIGRWAEVFGNDNPITLELGCGKGDYTIALAEMFPHRNFIGIDIKTDRIWRGAKRALEAKMNNVVFLRAYIDNLEKYFAKDEVEEIWITFPDPYPRKSKWKKRLTSVPFLERYRKVIKPGSQINLKTDDPALFEFSLTSAEEAGLMVEEVVRDVHGQKNLGPLLEIKTTFEKRHLADGRKIYYLRTRVDK